MLRVFRVKARGTEDTESLALVAVKGRAVDNALSCLPNHWTTTPHLFTHSCPAASSRGEEHHAGKYAMR